jgi:hypothetical protein
MAPTDQPAACGLARPVGPEWQPGVLLVEKCLEPHDAADLQITPKEISDEDGMLLDHGIVFIVAGIHWHFSPNGIQATAEPEESGITVSGRCDLAGEPPTIPPEGEKYYIELNEATVQFGGNGLGRVWGLPGSIANVTQGSFVLDCKITNDSQEPVFNLTLSLGILFIEPIYLNGNGGMKYGTTLPARRWDLKISRIAERGGLFRFYVHNFSDNFARVSLPDDVSLTYKNKSKNVKLIKSSNDYFELFPRAKDKQ